MQDPQWYGEVLVQYPLSQNFTTTYFSLVFYHRSRFRMIVNDYCASAYMADLEVTIEKAYKLYMRLKEWYASLPPASQSNLRNLGP